MGIYSAGSDLEIRRGPGHPDPEIRVGGGGGVAVSKNFFGPLGLSLVPLGPSPGAATDLLFFYI